MSFDLSLFFVKQRLTRRDGVREALRANRNFNAKSAKILDAKFAKVFAYLCVTPPSRSLR